MQFAAMMQRAVLDRAVVDQTGLSGTYDFDLEWTPDESQFGGNLPRSAESTKPSLFTAMQEQLGLKLGGNQGAGSGARDRPGRAAVGELVPFDIMKAMSAAGDHVRSARFAFQALRD